MKEPIPLPFELSTIVEFSFVTTILNRHLLI